MAKTVLLYGAGGFSGTLIAEAAAERWRAPGAGLCMALGGRQGAALRTLGDRLDMPTRVFALDDPAAVAVKLGGTFAVINAAGPFDLTAQVLAKAALRAGVHYVDIAGEADVYKTIDDLGYVAQQRRVAMVCGAGHTATVSNVMLRAALDYLRDRHVTELGAIRIALSHVRNASRGSVRSAQRAMRQQVNVVRGGDPSEHPPPGRPGMYDYRLTHVPVGQLERAFDFDGPPAPERNDDDAKRPRSGKRIACAVNLIDTLAARVTAAGYMDRVQRIESYLEMSDTMRAGLQWGAFAAPLMSIPGVRAMTQHQIDLLPEGPDADERQDERHAVLLQVDGAFGQPLIDWRMETPNPYDFTPSCVLAVIDELAKENGKVGWRTPGDMLAIDFPGLDERPKRDFRFGDDDLLAGCVLTRRRTASA